MKTHHHPRYREQGSPVAARSGPGAGPRTGQRPETALRAPLAIAPHAMLAKAGLAMAPAGAYWTRPTLTAALRALNAARLALAAPPDSAAD